MPIYEYNELDHPAGFVGLRVSVSVGAKLRQKYFPFRKRGDYISALEERQLRQDAGKLHDQWKAEQEQARQKASEKAEEIRQSVYCTGVRGIKLKFAVEKKFREGRWKQYYAPIFYVSGSVKGKLFTRRFYISDKQTFAQAWKRAVEYYALKKSIKSGPLLKRRPAKEQLLKVWKYMRRKGHKIPRHKAEVQ